MVDVSRASRLREKQRDEVSWRLEVERSENGVGRRGDEVHRRRKREPEGSREKGEQTSA